MRPFNLFNDQGRPRKIDVDQTDTTFRLIKVPFRHNISTIELENGMTILLEKFGAAVPLYLDADDYEICKYKRNMVKDKRADGKMTSFELFFYLTTMEDLVKETYNQTKNHCKIFS